MNATQSGRRRAIGLLATLSLALSAGCTGAIEDATTASMGAGPANSSPGEPPRAEPNIDQPHAESTGIWSLQRLTNREYNNTVRDLLGLAADYRGIALPGDVRGASGFLNAGDVTTLHAQTLLETAEELARNALQKSSIDILPCSPAGASAEEACALRFIRELGKRAFRRPLAPDEIADLTALYR